MRMVGVLSAAIGLGVAALVVALTVSHQSTPAEPGEAAVPQHLAGYSYLTGSVSDSPPGTATALFQHGFGVEFLDFPQAVVLGAGGDTYRRVDVAEDRAGGETQGDPAPMLLSPDGTKVAVGDHDTGTPDVVIVDLLTGTTSTHPLPSGQSVIPVAFSGDGETLALLLSPAATSPYSGGRITGEVGLLDLTDDTTVVLPEGDATAVAFSPDGTELAVERSGPDGVGVSILDLASGSRRDLGAEGLLAGPTAWSPDGRLLAITTVRPSEAPSGVADPGIPTGLAFVDPAGRGVDVPGPLELPLSGAGRVLAWTGSNEVVILLDVVGKDDCCGPEAATLSAISLDGAEPRTLMRLSDLTSYGVGRFQMAASTASDLQVVSPSDVDRGPWPLPWRGALALLLGLLAWLVSRLALGRMAHGPASTIRRTSSRSMS
ncbi:MAG: hypothetical protein LH477_07890 [Nocardioides sp.]|nr:hypothetical protein [Nocardioides sp.]